MKVALVQSTPLPPEEGIGNYTLRLARALRDAGHEPIFFTRGGGKLAGHDQVAGFPVHRPWFMPAYPFHVHLHARPMRKALAEARPDVVHMHVPLPPQAAPERVPVLATFHTPLVGSVGSIPRTEPRYFVSRLQLPVGKRVEAAILRRADHVTAVSRSVRDDLRGYCNAPDTIEVVPNGIDLARVPPRRGDGDPGRLLYVGRLAPRKGLADLVDAMRTVVTRRPEVCLDIVGKGPLRPWLEDRVRRLGIGPWVRFHGFVSPSALEALWRTAHLFIHVPQYEGMPTTVLEAMARRVPIVTSNAPGCRDLIDDGKEGVVVPVGAPDAVANAVLSLMDDPARASFLANGARRRVDRDHNWPDIAARYMAIYEELSRR